MGLYGSFCFCFVLFCFVFFLIPRWRIYISGYLDILMYVACDAVMYLNGCDMLGLEDVGKREDKGKLY